MRSYCASEHRRGITLIELLCATAVMAAVAVVTVARANVRAEANRARCAMHLKEMNLAFRQFASDNGDRFPMAISQRLGGAREAAQGSDVAGIFRVLAPYQADAGFARCPGDSRQAAAKAESLQRENISYFLNLDAAKSESTAVLLGDRDLTEVPSEDSNRPLLTGLRKLEGTQGTLSWSGELHRRESGNLARVDGTVVRVRSAELWGAFPAEASPARLLFPQ